MYQEQVVLCGASAYEQKYYFNRDFSELPESVQQELQAMCVLFTEDVGGVLTLEFDDDGNLDLKVQAEEDDLLFDEIGSALKIKQLQRDKQELFEALELFYRIFFLEEYVEGMDAVIDDMRRDLWGGDDDGMDWDDDADGDDDDTDSDDDTLDDMRWEWP